MFIPIKKLPPLFSPWVHSRSLRSPGPLARLAFRPRAVGRLRAMHYGQNRAPVPLHRSWRKLLGNPDRANNYAERCMRSVAVGRKAFLFVGSERAGHAAAIYYSLVESCKANKVNPLTYLTYVLTHARNKSLTLRTPDEFTASNIAHVG